LAEALSESTPSSSASSGKAFARFWLKNHSSASSARYSLTSWQEVSTHLTLRGRVAHNRSATVASHLLDVMIVPSQCKVGTLYWLTMIPLQKIRPLSDLPGSQLAHSPGLDHCKSTVHLAAADICRTLTTGVNNSNCNGLQRNHATETNKWLHIQADQSMSLMSIDKRTPGARSNLSRHAHGIASLSVTDLTRFSVIAMQLDRSLPAEGHRPSQGRQGSECGQGSQACRGFR
jgi:hypothetical protein